MENNHYKKVHYNNTTKDFDSPKNDYFTNSRNPNYENRKQPQKITQSGTLVDSGSSTSCSNQETTNQYNYCSKNNISHPINQQKPNNLIGHPVQNNPIKINYPPNNNIINDNQNKINQNISTEKTNNITKNNTVINNIENTNKIKTEEHPKKTYARKHTIGYNKAASSKQLNKKFEENENALNIINTKDNKKNILKEHWQLEKILLDYNILDFSSK